jgi:hypothetical protein
MVHPLRAGCSDIEDEDPPRARGFPHSLDTLMATHGAEDHFNTHLLPRTSGAPASSL